MKKTLRAAIAATLTACVHGFAPAASAKVLYNQTGGYTGLGISSQVYVPAGTSFDNYDDQSADDFVVPAGVQWIVNEVKVAGYYGYNSGPSISENVYIYADNQGTPGAVVAQYVGVNGREALGNFDMKIQAVTLPSGHYWLSVSVNNSYLSSGSEWFWATVSATNNDSAQWRQPGNGLHSGCTTFKPQVACNGFGGPDDVFQLLGKSVRVQP